MREKKLNQRHDKLQQVELKGLLVPPAKKSEKRRAAMTLRR